MSSLCWILSALAIFAAVAFYGLMPGRAADRLSDFALLCAVLLFIGGAVCRAVEDLSGYLRYRRTRD